MNLQANTVSVKMPRGDQASFEEMQANGNALQAFICHQEAKLEHVDETKKHNSILAYLQSLADEYNKQLHIFKEAEAHRQRDIINAFVLMARDTQP